MIYIALAGVNPAARIMAAASCDYSVPGADPYGLQSVNWSCRCSPLFYVYIQVCGLTAFHCLSLSLHAKVIVGMPFAL